MIQEQKTSNQSHLDRSATAAHLPRPALSVSQSLSWVWRQGAVSSRSPQRSSPWYAPPLVNAEQGAQAAVRAKLRNSTTVFLVGNIEQTMEWYKRLGFESEYYPPGFAILSRDEIQIFLQQQPGYVAPDDPGRRERHAWNVYIITDDVKALYEEYSGLPVVKISRQLCRQDYGMTEFDLMDLNGHRLSFAQPIPAE